MSWRSTARYRLPREAALPPLTTIPVPSGEVQAGQVWASNDSRDRREGWRQERIVLDVRDNGLGIGQMIATLYTLPGKPHQSASDCGVEGGAILRHRFVRDASPAECVRFGL